MTSRTVSGVPERPLLAPWYRLARAGDALLLEHGQVVVALEGAAVRRLLPALLPLLDGTRTVGDVVAVMGTPVREAVQRALTALASHGLLLSGPDAPVDERASAHAAAALFGLPPGVAAERLRSASVDVVGSARVAPEIARLLHADGIARVGRAGWDAPPAASDEALVVVAPAPAEVAELDGWNRRALAAGSRWLPVLPHDGRFAAVGPLVVAGETCCWECLRLRRAANLDYGDDLSRIEAAPTAAQAGRALEALLAAAAAHLALRWLVGRDTTVVGVLHTLEVTPRVAIGQHAVLRVPRCPVCSNVERLAPPLPWHAAEVA